jgi:hypothetical protein
MRHKYQHWGTNSKFWKELGVGGSRVMIPQRISNASKSSCHKAVTMDESKCLFQKEAWLSAKVLEETAVWVRGRMHKHKEFAIMHYLICH